MVTANSHSQVSGRLLTSYEIWQSIQIIVFELKIKFRGKCLYSSKRASTVTIVVLFDVE